MQPSAARRGFCVPRSGAGLLCDRTIESRHVSAGTGHVPLILRAQGRRAQSACPGKQGSAVEFGHSACTRARQFILERMNAMLGLCEPSSAALDSAAVGGCGRECGVTGLPIEIAQALLLAPDSEDSVFMSSIRPAIVLGLRQPAQDMDPVGDGVNLQGRAFDVLERPNERAVEFNANVDCARLASLVLKTACKRTFDRDCGMS